MEFISKTFKLATYNDGAVLVSKCIYLFVNVKQLLNKKEELAKFKVVCGSERFIRFNAEASYWCLQEDVLIEIHVQPFI